MKPTTKIRTVAALRKAAANRRAVIGWSAARPDVEKPAAWVLRMPFDRVTEALDRGMEIYVPKVRCKGRALKMGEVIEVGDMWKPLNKNWQPSGDVGRVLESWDEGYYRRPIRKATP